MKTALQVLFGFAMGAAGVVTCLYLGLLVNASGPNWRTGVEIVLLLTATQWVAFFSFRHQVALQLLFGLVLCAAVTVGLIYSKLSFSWEVQYPDGSSPITWRSDVLLFLLLAATQGVAYLIFRRFRKHENKSLGTTAFPPR